MPNENLTFAASITIAANRLLDVTEAHIREVEATNVIARKSASSLEASSDSLARVTDAIPKTLEKNIKQSLDGAAEKAAKLLSDKFTEADEKAIAAAKRYDKAVNDYETATKMVRWQIMLPVGIFCFIVSASILGCAYWAVHSLTPSDAEIQGRRNLILQLNSELSTRKEDIQKAERQLVKLNKKVQALRHTGGTLKLEDCVDAQEQTRLCIRVSDGQQWVQRIVQEVSE